MSFKKADRNEKWGLDTYGAEKWNQICDYEDDKNERKERVFAAVKKPESMAQLFSILNAFLGEDMHFHYTANVEKQYINIASGVDLSDRPLIKLAWKEFRVENFSGGIGTNEAYYSSERDYSKPVKEVFYWTSIHFAYRHHDGGSNGATIGTAVFNEDGKWIFTPEIQEIGGQKNEW